MFRILFILLFFAGASYGQSADFIVLKKKGRNVQTFFKGGHIEFQTITGAYRDAQIRDIRNDSIFLQEFLVNRVFTTLGFYVNDTAGSYSYQYSYKDIYRFGKDNKKFNVNGSGAALMGGGILLTLASGVSYIADKDKFSPELLAAAVGLGGIGYLLSKAGSKGIVVGKKHYTIEYIHVSAK